MWGLIAPEPFGSPADDTYSPPSIEPAGNRTLRFWHGGVLVYPGVLIWLLAPFALRDIRRHPFALEALLLVAGTYMVVYIGPLHDLVQSVPGLGFSRLDRLLAIGGFGLGLLAAAGSTGLRQTGRRPAVLISIGAGVVLAGLLATLASRVASPAGLPGVWRTAGMAALGLATLIATIRLRNSAPWTRWLLFAVLLADLLPLGRAYYMTVPSRDLLPPTGVIRFLQANLGHDRLLRYDTPAPRANTPRVFQLRDAQGFAPLFSGRYRQFFDLIEPDRTEGYRLLRQLRARESLSSPLLRILGIRYLIAEEEVDHADWTRIHRGEGLVLLESRQPALRARVVPSWETVETDDRAAALLTEPGFDPETMAVVVGPGPAHASEMPTPATRPDTGVAGTARFIEDTPRRVELEVDAPDGGLLVLADTFHPGWRATLDGKTVPIRRADLAFRAVRVPAGRSRVTFTYAPAALRSAGALSLVAILAAMSLGIWPRRRQDPPAPRGGGERH